MLEETISISCLISLKGDFNGFYELTAGTIKNELQDIRNVSNFVTAKLIRSDRTISCIVFGSLR